MATTTAADDGPDIDQWLPLANPDGSYPLARDAIPFEVCRYDGGAEGDPFEPIPNMICTQISRPLGADPGTARLKYRFGMVPTQYGPTEWTEAVDDSPESVASVQPDDRIVVRAFRPDGVWIPVFDGFAVAFEVYLGPKRQVVSVLLVGVAVRCFDTPIDGALWRDGAKPNSIDDMDQIQTELVAHMNPKGRGNCVGGAIDGRAGDDTSKVDDVTTWYKPPDNGIGDPEKDNKYPVFIDPDNPAVDHQMPPLPGKPPCPWYYHTMARYIVYKMNAAETFVRNPDGGSLDDTLWSWEPKPGKLFKYSDTSSFNLKRIPVPDKPITARTWPTLIEEVIGAKGFATLWNLEAGEDDYGSPVTSYQVIHPQSQTPKTLKLQEAGQHLDISLSNVGEADLSRSVKEVVDNYIVEGREREIEASFVLACGFQCAPADAATAASINAFSKSDPNWTTSNHDKYRKFILDEIGAGSYLPQSNTIQYEVADLSKIMQTGVPITDPPQPKLPWVARYRKPYPDLVTRDEQGHATQAQLHISTDYVGPCPAVWDYNAVRDPETNKPITPGTWQPIEGGWDLLKDQVGVYLNVGNPNDWKIGKSAAANMPYPAGIVRVVETMANAAGQNLKKFYLRLTVKIRADVRLKGTCVVNEDVLDPSVPEKITRYVDAHDRYRFEGVYGGSANNLPPIDVVVRDDTAAASAEATAAQLVSMNGLFGGTVTIPRFTQYYQVGDIIGSIDGVDVSLRTDGDKRFDDDPQSEPVYPVVVAISHPSLDTKQTTVLELSDASYARRSYVHRSKQRGKANAKYH